MASISCSVGYNLSNWEKPSQPPQIKIQQNKYEAIVNYCERPQPLKISHTGCTDTPKLPEIKPINMVTKILSDWKIPHRFSNLNTMISRVSLLVSTAFLNKVFLMKRNSEINVGSSNSIIWRFQHKRHNQEKTTSDHSHGNLRVPPFNATPLPRKSRLNNALLLRDHGGY